MTAIFEMMDTVGTDRLVMLRDGKSGLKAIIALDSLVLGPAFGGIRTQPYATVAAAFADVAKLSRAMTLKCAIAGLDAGGGKTVVIDHPGMERGAAFSRLGSFIEEFGGLYRCAGDLGTTHHDLLNVAGTTQYCDVSGEALGDATGVTILNGIRACAAARDITDLSSLSIAVQGAGLIGAGVARAMAALGARVLIADLDGARAKALADELGANVVDSASVLAQDVDIISPCAVGGVLTMESVASIKAWAVCGGANNQLSHPQVGDVLASRRIDYVPDFLASSGAVIMGVCRSSMHTDPQPILAAVEHTARDILRAAQERGCSTVSVAEDMARHRIAAKGARS